MKRLILPLLLCLLLPTATLAEDYVVAENDVLSVSVWGEEALSVTAKVRPDGKITIPGLRDVQAAGLTPMDLTDVLEERLGTIVQNPIVTVTVQEIAPRRLYVFHEKASQRPPWRTTFFACEPLASSPDKSCFHSHSLWAFAIRPGALWNPHVGSCHL
jgi:hypothetical protein